MKLHFDKRRRLSVWGQEVHGDSLYFLLNFSVNLKCTEKIKSDFKNKRVGTNLSCPPTVAIPAPVHRPPAARLVFSSLCPHPHSGPIALVLCPSAVRDGRCWSGGGGLSQARLLIGGKQQDLIVALLLPLCHTVSLKSVPHQACKGMMPR